LVRHYLSSLLLKQFSVLADETGLTILHIQYSSRSEIKFTPVAFRVS